MENRAVFLLGDFNIDLLNYDQHSPTYTFFDTFCSHMLLRHVVQLTRIRNYSKILIDNIYSNVITPVTTSDNPTATISEQLFQFLIIPDILSSPLSTKLNTLGRY